MATVGSSGTLPPASPRAGLSRVRIGGLAWILGAIQFLVAMIVVQLAWTTPYNAADNAISDLGAVTCHENPLGTSYVCSPLHVVFNASIIGFGILIALGAIACRPALPSGRVAACACAILTIAGAGAALVGIFPEDTIGLAHALGATMAFAGSAVALILLGFSMRRKPSWTGYGALSFGCGIVSGGTIIALDISEKWGPLGFGGLERLILAPALVWLVVVGTRLAWRPSPPVPEVSSHASNPGPG
jgi:hypothetical membrane protein